ncbi:MAG: carbohydrate-binding protein [Planctomycetes bacterium]|nr:carbohydrate-binding protein [Planctomycetota bacterium]
MNNGRARLILASCGMLAIFAAIAQAQEIAVPGRVQAEDYKAGGEGVGYHDTDAVNQGGAYRQDGVDIQATSDTGGGYNVGWIRTGEWLAYNVRVGTAGSYAVTARVASGATATKSIHLEVDGQDVSGTVGFTSNSGYQSWIDLSLPNVSLTAGAHTLRLFIEAGGFNLNYIDFRLLVPVARAVPGRVEAEDYKLGGEVVAYHDTDTVNQGGAYRRDGVDIQATSDTGGGYNVGWIRTGEWLAYDVQVETTGSYAVIARVATGATDMKSIHLEVDGGNVSGSVPFTNTSGWQAWIDLALPNVSLSAGAHEVRVVIETGGFNLNYVEFSAVSVPAGHQLPGRIEAEDYKLGGEGVAYHDTDTVNQGGAYRQDGVDIQVTSDTGGGYNVGWIQTGEWLAYDANVREAGAYRFQLRLASGRTAVKAIHVEVDGTNVTGTMSFSNDAGWQSYFDLTGPEVVLTSGPHEVRVVVEVGGFNFNAIEAVASSGAAPPPPPPSQGPIFVFFGHSQGTMDDVATLFRPRLRAGDIVLVKSFHDGAYDQDFLLRNARMLREAVPGIVLFARADGRENVRTVVNSLPSGVYDGILYGYDWFDGGSQAPEFSWDDDTTYQNFETAKQIANARGYPLYGMPTGRPVLVTNPRWDYGILATHTDGLIPQLQGYAQNSWSGDDPRTFDQAVRIVSGQIEAAGATQPWMPQLTIGTELSNGMPWDAALPHARQALSLGAAGITIQWTGPAKGDVPRFLQALGR